MIPEPDFAQEKLLNCPVCKKPLVSTPSGGWLCVQAAHTRLIPTALLAERLCEARKSRPKDEADRQSTHDWIAFLRQRARQQQEVT